MYTSFEVRNFRCLHQLGIDQLKSVNLIAGVNNVGKTAVLEALFVHSGAYNPELALKISVFRGIEMLKVELGPWVGGTLWDSLFGDYNTARTVEIVGELGEAGVRVVRLRVLREAGELESTGQFAATGFNNLEDIALSSDVAQVLTLEYEEPTGAGTYHLIIDDKGPRVRPIPPPPPFPAFFQADRFKLPVGEQAKLFRKLQLERREAALVDILRVLEPRLQGLELIMEGGEPLLHGDTGGSRPIPLPLMGGGMVRLASLVLRMSNAGGGVVLVDEIENGLHHSVLTDVWRAVGRLARQFDTQVFATTHSRECIVAAHTAFRESFEYDFRLHRLDRVGDGIRAVTYDRDTLEAAIETGLEVR